MDTIGPIVASNNTGLTDCHIIGDADDVPIANSDNVRCINLTSSLVTWLANGQKTLEFQFATGDAVMCGTTTMGATDSYFE